jgi:hypothetical protein
MRFVDIINEHKRRLNDYTAETALAVELAINNYYFELWSKNLWWFARRPFTFDTVAPYTTGTITVTEDSATVTGSGTAFTSAMIGRKLVVSGDNNSYEIKSVGSTTSLTLETVYKGTTGGSKTYGIYKSVYRMDDRCFKVLWIKQNYRPGVLKEDFERETDRIRATPYEVGDPLRYCQRGQTTSAYYSTGYVSMTNGSATITGSGTTFDSTMVGMVFKVLGDGIEYKISAFVSATELTLSKVYDGTSNLYATSTYEIGPAGCETIEVDPLPDKIVQLKGKMVIRPLKLIADNDVPELPEQWHWLLLEGSFAAVAPGRVSESRVTIAMTKVEAGEKDLMKWHNVSEDENPSILQNFRDDRQMERRSTNPLDL